MEGLGWQEVAVMFPMVFLSLVPLATLVLSILVYRKVLRIEERLNRQTGSPPQ